VRGVFVCLLLSSLYLNDLFKQKSMRAADILLIAIGKVDIKVIERLRDDLSTALNREVSLGKEMPEPDYAFHEKSNQYLSTAILKILLKQKEYASCEKVLGIADHDLHVPELNFVFGEAGRKAAVISLTRLRQEFYGMPEDKHLFYRRALTEAVHELGHTYGLSHCSNPGCVMFFSNSLPDTDRKGFEFCPGCKDKLLKSF